MDIKRNIIFTVEKRKKNGVLNTKNMRIKMRITYDGKRIDIFIKKNINLEDWNTEKQRAKNDHKINAQISRFEKLANDAFAQFEVVEKRIPTIQELREAINPIQKESKKSLEDILNEFIKNVSIKNNWSMSTAEKYEVFKNQLIEFDKNISMQYISETKLLNFIQYLHKKELKNTTIAKKIDYLRTFLRWCYNKGYYKGNLQNTFSPKLKGTDGNSKEVIHLTWDELQHLMNFEFERKVLDETRDVFCFLCFTGLRYSDVAKLKKTDVKEDHIIVVTQKTSELLKIDLNKYSKAILEKYKDKEFFNDLVLPVVGSTAININIKAMAKKAGINDPQRIVYFKKNERIEKVYPKYAVLSSHAGRRTFIVNAMYLGIPAEVIMKWTGHSDHKSMKPYMKIVDDLKKTEMNKFNTK